VSNLPVLITQQGLLMWLGGVVTTLFCGILGSLYRFSVDWFNNLYLKNEIENIKLRSELNAIKSRLNPHFLFNTLNNIDSLISTNPQKASIVLSMLSDLFRYVVYDTEQEKIAIQKELEIIQKYIDLEKIRITNPDAVSFACAVDNNLLISPMTLIPFIENAFKHSNLNQHNNKVSISVTEKSNELVFRCINSIGMPENENNLKEKGIGLKLIQERLKLLYPNSHHLQIVRQNDEFDVTLKINLIND
jgi:LytS/YehU family sensor histidine kinase